MREANLQEIKDKFQCPAWTLGMLTWILLSTFKRSILAVMLASRPLARIFLFSDWEEDT